MRVLSVIITPPSYRASGGVSAGLKLAEQLAGLVGMKAAIMSDRDAVTTRGKLTVRHFKCTNPLGALLKVAPRQLAATFWTSAIPEYIAQYRPDLVHFHNPFPPRALLAGTEMCRREKIPFVISSHGFVEMTRFGAAFAVRAMFSPVSKMLVERPFAQAVKVADRIFILSPLERDLVARLGIPPERQVLVTNGVDVDFAAPVPADVRAALAKRLNWRTDVTNLLFVGNLTYNKGIDVLLSAMQQTKTPVRLTVAGALRSPDQATALLQDAGIAPNDERIVFTDHVSFDELRSLYQMADVFVFPSRADTLPLVILEAMVSGLPVIASDVGGIPYQVTDDCGIVFPSENSAALASAIDNLSGNSARRDAMSMAAPRRVASHFSWAHAAEEAARAYEQVLSSAKHPR